MPPPLSCGTARIIASADGSFVLGFGLGQNLAFRYHWRMPERMLLPRAVSNPTWTIRTPAERRGPRPKGLNSLALQSRPSPRRETGLAPGSDRPLSAKEDLLQQAPR